MDVVSPVSQYDIQGGNLKWDQDSLIEKKVPANHKAKSIINPFACHPDESAFNRHQDCHFGHAVIDETNEETVDDEAYQETARSPLGQTAPDIDEQPGADGAADGNELNLPIS
jgi:hypothetical protein